MSKVSNQVKQLENEVVTDVKEDLSDLKQYVITKEASIKGQIIIDEQAAEAIAKALYLKYKYYIWGGLIVLLGLLGVAIF